MKIIIIFTILSIINVIFSTVRSLATIMAAKYLLQYLTVDILLFTILYLSIR